MSIALGGAHLKGSPAESPPVQVSLGEFLLNKFQTMSFGLDHAERTHDGAKKNHKCEKVVGPETGRCQKNGGGEGDNIIRTLIFISRLCFLFCGD